MRKHGIDFETAVLVFDDPYALSELDRIIEGEERWQTVGTARFHLVLIAHLWWDDNGEEVVRVISARKASSAEKKAYEANKKAK